MLQSGHGIQEGRQEGKYEMRMCKLHAARIYYITWGLSDRSAFRLYEGKHWKIVRDEVSAISEEVGTGSDSMVSKQI